MRTLLKYAKNAAKCQICGNRIFAFFWHPYVMSTAGWLHTQRQTWRCCCDLFYQNLRETASAGILLHTFTSNKCVFGGLQTHSAALSVPVSDMATMVAFIRIRCCLSLHSRAMSQQKRRLIFKISSSLSSAIFDVGIYSNWQMNIYLMSSVKLVKFDDDNIMQTPHSPSTCSVMQLLVDTYLKIYADNCASIMH